MAQGIAKGWLVGNVGKVRDLHYTPSGTAVLSFSMAIDKGKEQDTDWWDVSVFGKQAETLKELLPKARSLVVEGRLQKRSYENKQQQKVTVTELVASTVNITSWKKDAATAGSSDQEEDEGNYPF